MATTLTLKNIPDDVYHHLKASAEMHRRSLNSEAIVCLESVLLPRRVMPNERLTQIRELRSMVLTGNFAASDIDAFKREGRRLGAKPPSGGFCISGVRGDYQYLYRWL